MTLYPRASLHGADISAPTQAKLPQRAVMGATCMTEDLLGRFIWDADSEKWCAVEYVAFEYDQTVDGSTQGHHTLSQFIPEDTIVLDGCYDVIDPLTPAAVRIRLSAQTNGDILATAACSSVGTSGLHDIYPDGSAAKAFKTTADRYVVLTIDTAPLNSGKLVGYLRCLRAFPAAETSSSSSSSSPSSSVSSVSSASSASSSSSSSVSSSSSSSSSVNSSSSSVSSSSSSIEESHSSPSSASFSASSASSMSASSASSPSSSVSSASSNSSSSSSSSSEPYTP